MHDPTEGGLVTGLHELAWASGVGVRVYRERVPVLPACQTLCEGLALDPLGLIASGALLVAVAPESVAALGAAYEREGICWAEIGTFVPRAEGLLLIENGVETPLPCYDRDEFTRLLTC
jgi:hydrogenase maturation factor